MDQPGEWPGEQSGITLGHGYDLSAVTLTELRRDWSPYLRSGEIGALAATVGKSGPKAKALAPALRGIRVTRAAAEAVFMVATLPKYVRLTISTFPHLAALPLDAQGALVSLVFNRGSSLTGDRRREMLSIYRTLADGVQAGDLALIAAQIRASKRLWLGRGVDGLLTRRENEALLVQRSGV